MRLADQKPSPGGVTAGAAESLASTLREVIAGFERLNRDTERAFLITGGRLSAFLGTVTLMSSGLQSVAELISGERGREAAQALNSVLDLSKGMSARAGEQNGLLVRMREEGKRIKSSERVAGLR
jgi:hypothetical protein